VQSGRTRGPCSSFLYMQFLFKHLAFIPRFSTPCHIGTGRLGLGSHFSNSFGVHHSYEGCGRCQSIVCVLFLPNSIPQVVDQFFVFLIVTTIANMYIMYIAHLQRFRPGPPGRQPMIHLQFKIQLCEALLQNWPRRREDGGEN
jgi:hypothetical protein